MRVAGIRDGIRAGVLAGMFLMLASPSVARGDGGFFVETESSSTQAEAANQGLLASSGQRAVIWQITEDCWDLYVEPGRVALESAAWVMPLPVVPEVTEASPTFIDQLDAATVPVFWTQREVLRFTDGGGDGCGCLGADSAGSGTEPVGEDSTSDVLDVTVWGQGRLGDLAYEIVSSEDAEALETWLSNNGYAVPDTLDATIEPYVDDGYVFFAAQVDREAGSAEAISVAKFHLCDTAGLWYPLRLSAYSVAETFDFTLWLVDPVAYVAPTDSPWSAPGEFFAAYLSINDEDDYNQHRDEIETPFADLYAARLDEIFTANPDRSMVVQYAGQIHNSDLATRLDLLTDAGVSPPLSPGGEDWAPELASIIGEGRVVTRWLGRMTPDGMEQDLHLRPTVLLDEDRAIYSRTFTFWDYTPPDLDAGGDAIDALGAVAGSRRFASAAMLPSHGRRARSAWLLGILCVGAAVWARRFRPRHP